MGADALNNGKLAPHGVFAGDPVGGHRLHRAMLDRHANLAGVVIATFHQRRYGAAYVGIAGDKQGEFVNLLTPKIFEPAQNFNAPSGWQAGLAIVERRHRQNTFS